MDTNSLSIFYQFGSIFYSDNCWQAIFTCNNRSVCHQSANFGDKTFNGYKQECPARVSKSCDQYIPIHEVSVLYISTCSSSPAELEYAPTKLENNSSGSEFVGGRTQN
jgi:hypothetical protein